MPRGCEIPSRRCTAHRSGVLNATAARRCGGPARPADKRQYARQCCSCLQHTRNLQLRERWYRALEVRAGGPRPQHNQDGSGTVGRITGVRTFFGSVYAAPARDPPPTAPPRGADLGGPAVRLSAGRGRRAGSRRPSPKRCRPRGSAPVPPIKTGTPRGWTAAVLPWIQLESSPSDAARPLLLL